ncbi:DEAD/DEAH box helicase [Gordonia sp. NB41Y]|uniref:DEAD/DEAH box helicase n=1 Tax=Gordonia sp. NB41Y TaxID=875808 RepID=UPI0006B1A74E|nr:DEAD/DEAH box helicase [Gordonia sp. NB41Y]KOY49713.1 hypothetical protein ISGA_08345 [Gordonia sp. NB41Y]WLP92854.1 DEAD/DEAH box helicase [Gordonia sp. NB41Y]
MSDPVLRLTEGQLAREFGTQTAARGRQYARAGKIFGVEWVREDDGWLLAGESTGSHRRGYDVSVYFFGPPSLATIEYATCSCPVGVCCKHTVGLLLTAAAASQTQPAQPAQPAAKEPVPGLSWRAVLDNLIGLPAAGTGISAPKYPPLALTFARSRSSGSSPILTVRPMTAGARGNWIKSGASWSDIAYGKGLATGAPDHVAVGALYTAITGRTVVTSGDWLPIAQSAAQFWPALRAAVDAGVTLLADPSLKVSGIRIGDAALHYDVSPHADGGAQLTAGIVIDGLPVDAGTAEAFGMPAHGVGAVGDGMLSLGEFERSIKYGELNLAMNRTVVVIPAEDLDEFSAEALPRLTGARTVRTDPAAITAPTIIGPKAVLTIAGAPGNQARFTWSIAYQVNDKLHLFEPASPAASVGYRDELAEKRLWTELEALFDPIIERCGAWASALRSTTFPLTAVQAAVLIAEGLPGLTGHRDVFIDNRVGADFAPADDSPVISFGADEKVGNDWFSLDVTMNVGEYELPIAAVISELSHGATHMFVDAGTYVALDSPELATLAKLLAEARELGEIENGLVNPQSLNATLWEELLDLGVVDKQLAGWRKRMTKLAAATPPKRVAVPRTLKASLREYQRDGLDWLTFLRTNEIGGILADDMGLGKTVQTLAFIARECKADTAARFLVVAPTSVVPNWIAECERFAPSLHAVPITTTEARSEVPMAEAVDGAQVVVTSYTLLRLNFEQLDEHHWTGVIFDEAQFIKNHNGRTHQCARRLDAPFKLAITGTPMENNLMELWSLLSVTAPGLFGSPKIFAEYFRKPIESGQHPERMEVLRRRIKPVMLRRRKDQVAIDLPAKQEQVMLLDLVPKHRKIYDTRLARERQKVLGLLGDWEKNRFQVFRSLNMLRQLSLHAGLVDDTDYAVESGKVDYLTETLPELIAEQHSALVFSQFTRFLGILRDELDTLGIAYSYLDGTMSAAQRAAAVKEFSDGQTQVFLISLKAGGFGLNLTEADYCFVCDPWWNPAAESQAIDRAHRIGQTRPVTVYRLVSSNTIEERVVALQDRKRALFDAAVDEGELFGGAITAADIQQMLG